jgi:Arc/MetJ-type ribon-helix-helix transcriptional regulator
MQTLNISVTTEQEDYVRRCVERDFGNVSEFFRELIRERMKREIDEDLDFLSKTSEGALAGPSEKELDQILKTQREVRKELRRAGHI